MLFFALLVVVLFSLAFDPTRAVSGKSRAEFCASRRCFAAVSALNQAWARELRNQVLDALRMTPAPAASLFLGKTLANFLFVMVVEVVLAPVFVMFYKPARAGQCMAARAGAAAGDVGADRERSFLCCAVDPDAESRIAAAADPVSDFYSGASGM